MRGAIVIFILFLIGCATPAKDKIIVPKLHAGFYSDALQRINEELESDPNDERLVDQKLFYCEQLDWPETCISALDAYKATNGMTNQLVEQYIVYYKKHEQYQLLLEVINQWEEEYDLESQYREIYIDCLTRLGEKSSAFIELKEYLKEHQTSEAITFASGQYLTLNDTALAAYNLGKLYKLSPESDLMWEYGIILIELGYEQIGFEVMDEFVSKNSADSAIQISYAKLLKSANQNERARNLLKPYTNEDSIAFILAGWYKNDLLWDSASYVLSNIVAKDSLARKPFWELGRLYEDRGWYLSSIRYFEYLIEIDPGDTLAQQRIDLIQRKIAYLQRLKFEESKIPTIELKPKKIDN